MNKDTGLKDQDLVNLIHFLSEIVEAEGDSDEGQIAKRQLTFLERVARGYILTATDDGRSDGIGRILWPPVASSWYRGYRQGIPAPVGTILLVLE